MFLAPAEIAELTGREKPSAQIRELERKGIAHLVNAAGRPVVTWAAVNARMGTERLAVRLGAQTLIRGQISAFSGAAR